MSRGRKPAHVRSYLRQYHLCYMPAHPGDALEKLNLPLRESLSRISSLKDKVMG